VSVKVVGDSTSYIPTPLRESLDIRVAMLSSELDGASYPDDPDDCAAFYDALAASSAFPTTSQPPVQALVDLIEGHVAEGHDVVGVFISSLMSGTYSTALLARDMVRERYPDAVIEIVDGRSNSLELGFAVLAAARKAAEGGTAEECVAAAEDMTLHTRFLFTPLTLEYLRRGGRIGNASALLATLLQIKPVLTVVNGVTDTFAKVRTLQKSHDLILGTFIEDVRGKGGLGDVYVHHIHDAAAGRSFADRVAEVAGRAVEIRDIGPAVGTHVGPGTVGLVYWTNALMNKAGN
jgi:DegV family protein with EDD domain